MSGVTSSIASTLVTCVGCQAGMEHIQQLVPHSLNLATFASFIFVSLHGLIFHSKFFSVEQKVPTSEYVKMVVINFIVLMCNNYSMRFHVYFPLFIIFKSSSLIAHLFLRSTLRNQLFNTQQIGSILVVTAGVAIFTLASYEPRSSVGDMAPEWTESLPFSPFWIGILLLTIAIFLSAYVGICQQDVYSKYGRHHEEAMFYVHFLSIPAFALVGGEMSPAFTRASSTPPLMVIGYNTMVPAALMEIFALTLFQFYCVRSIYRLTSSTSSLNVNMVISIRKVISLAVSFYVFGNPFNAFHFLGAIVVFIGTIAYALVF